MRKNELCGYTRPSEVKHEEHVGTPEKKKGARGRGKVSVCSLIPPNRREHLQTVVQVA